MNSRRCCFKQVSKGKPMIRLLARSAMYVVLGAALIVCCAVVAQSQRAVQKPDAAVLADAPTVPQMLVDSDGTLHFGPRTVPPPALASAEARESYTRQMLRRAQTAAGRGGLAAARILEVHPAPRAA